MTRTGDREIGAVSGRLPDNPGELACMCLLFLDYSDIKEFLIRLQKRDLLMLVSSKNSFFDNFLLSLPT